jgi:hypothetical protein
MRFVANKPNLPDGFAVNFATIGQKVLDIFSFDSILDLLPQSYQSRMNGIMEKSAYGHTNTFLVFGICEHEWVTEIDVFEHNGKLRMAPERGKIADWVPITSRTFNLSSVRF